MPASRPHRPFSLFDALVGQFAVAQAVLSWDGPQLHPDLSLFFFTDRAGMSPERFRAAPSPRPEELWVDDLHRNDEASWGVYEVKMSPAEFHRAIHGARAFLEGDRSKRQPHWVLTVAVVLNGGVWVESFTFDYPDKFHGILYHALDPENARGRETIREQRRWIDGRGVDE